MAELWSGLGGVVWETAKDGQKGAANIGLRYTNTEVLLMIWSHPVSGCTILEYCMDFQKTRQYGWLQNPSNVYLQTAHIFKY